ncbi:hypothetical protein QJS04_geneDACA005761 [Acorus gramineus]|uniref:Uncharacterized protein n=1 Tax=Acorus gramineus TaxID=55184 RepID=A0AAV9BI86_ACOGR|nr:hypothetical protein QJS04_geneDACA005761 [Acorus gramineus]
MGPMTLKDGPPLLVSIGGDPFATNGGGSCDGTGEGEGYISRRVVELNSHELMSIPTYKVDPQIS